LGRNSHRKRVGVASSNFLRAEPPGRVFAVFACVEKADLVAVWIFQVSLTPQPWTVGRVFVEVQAEFFQAYDLGVEVFAFEVKHDIVDRLMRREFIDRQSRVAIRTLKPGVTRQRIDNTTQAKFFKELDGFDRFVGVETGDRPSDTPLSLSTIARTH